MNSFQLFFLFIRVPLDYIALLLAAFFAYLIRLSESFTQYRQVNIGLGFDQYMHAAYVVGLVWLVVFALTGLYSTDPNRKFSSEMYRIFVACVSGFAAVAVLVFLRGELFNSRFIVLAASVLALLFVFVERMLVRLILRWFHAAGVGNSRVVIIGDDESADIISRDLKGHPYLGKVVVHEYEVFSLKVAASIRMLRKHSGVDEMIFTNVSDKKQALEAIAFCEDQHIAFTYAADLFATFAPAKQMHVISGVPLIELRPTRLQGWGRIMKRIADVVSSLFLIVLLSPVFIAVMMLVAIETGTPIIFKNERVGERGRLFNVLKFRTMYQKDSVGGQFKGSQAALRREMDLIKMKSKKQGPVYKIIDDPRVTPIGQVLRRWSLDELPQLFNVLMGSMSMVGPRPHQPREVAQYELHHKKVLAIKPGITGLAQISGRSDLSFEEEVQLDTVYIEEWSLLTDIFIVLKTPLVIIKKDGAY